MEKASLDDYEESEEMVSPEEEEHFNEIKSMLTNINSNLRETHYALNTIKSIEDHENQTHERAKMLLSTKENTDSIIKLLETFTPQDLDNIAHDSSSNIIQNMEPTFLEQTKLIANDIVTSMLVCCNEEDLSSSSNGHFVAFGTSTGIIALYSIDCNSLNTPFKCVDTIETRPNVDNDIRRKITIMRNLLNNRFGACSEDHSVYIFKSNTMKGYIEIKIVKQYQGVNAFIEIEPNAFVFGFYNKEVHLYKNERFTKINAITNNELMQTCLKLKKSNSFAVSWSKQICLYDREGHSIGESQKGVFTSKVNGLFEIHGDDPINVNREEKAKYLVVVYDNEEVEEKRENSIVFLCMPTLNEVARVQHSALKTTSLECCFAYCNNETLLYANDHSVIQIDINYFDVVFYMSNSCYFDGYALFMYGNGYVLTENVCEVMEKNKSERRRGLSLLKVHFEKRRHVIKSISEYIKKKNIHSAKISSMCKIDNNAIVVGFDKGDIKLFNINYNAKSITEICKQLSAHTAIINSICMITNNKFATASNDNNVKVWSINKANISQYMVLHTKTEPTYTHCNPVLSVHALNNEYIATCASYQNKKDFPLKVWNISSSPPSIAFKTKYKNSYVQSVISIPCKEKILASFNTSPSQGALHLYEYKDVYNYDKFPEEEEVSPSYTNASTHSEHPNGMLCLRNGDAAIVNGSTICIVEMECGSTINTIHDDKGMLPSKSICMCNMEDSCSFAICSEDNILQVSLQDDYLHEIVFHKHIPNEFNASGLFFVHDDRYLITDNKDNGLTIFKTTFLDTSP